MRDGNISTNTFILPQKSPDKKEYNILIFPIYSFFLFYETMNIVEPLVLLVKPDPHACNSRIQEKFSSCFHMADELVHQRNIHLSYNPLILSLWPFTCLKSFLLLVLPLTCLIPFPFPKDVPPAHSISDHCQPPASRSLTRQYQHEPV